MSDPNVSTDPRRITEHDADFARLYTNTVAALRASLRQYVAALRHDSRHDWQRAASTFIARHTRLLTAAYSLGYREGQRDWYGARSHRPERWVQDAPTPRVQRRLVFYAATSVPKLAREALVVAARELEATQTTAAQTFADPDPAGTGGASLEDWEKGAWLRIGLQGNISWTGGQDGYQDAGGDDPANNYLHLFWDLEPLAKHCFQCPDFAAGSPYDPPWVAGGNHLTTTPGAGDTDCGAACKCSLRYGSDEEATAANAWKLYWNIARMIVQGKAPLTALYDPETARQITLYSTITEEAAAPEPPPPPPDWRTLYANALPTWLPSWQGTNPTTTMDSLGGMLPGTPGKDNPELSDGMKNALDTYRTAWYQWQQVHGTLPSLPQLSVLFTDPSELANGGPSDALGFEQFLDSLPDWPELTTVQQMILHRWITAILELRGADVSAPNPNIDRSAKLMRR